ncbi:MAG TPA: hypothetical protein VJ836_00205 [Candidatus Saccharimonadales bacterium]|nr:hypothetical protein [Candidatus Saccharimonadales bacterium]
MFETGRKSIAKKTGEVVAFGALAVGSICVADQESGVAESPPPMSLASEPILAAPRAPRSVSCLWTVLTTREASVLLANRVLAHQDEMLRPGERRFSKVLAQSAGKVVVIQVAQRSDLSGEDSQNYGSQIDNLVRYLQPGKQSTSSDVKVVQPTPELYPGEVDISVHTPGTPC